MMEIKVVIGLDEATTNLLEGFKDLLAQAVGALALGQISQLKPFECVGEEEHKEDEKPQEKADIKPEIEEKPQAKEVKEVKEEKPQREVTLEDIRCIARTLADENRQDEYKAILAKYGYAKVNQIEKANYSVIYEEMAKLVEA